MLECTPCGSAIPPGLKLCPACGAPIPEVAASSASLNPYVYDEDDDDEFVEPVAAAPSPAVAFHLEDTAEVDVPPSLATVDPFIDDDDDTFASDDELDAFIGSDDDDFPDPEPPRLQPVVQPVLQPVEQPVLQPVSDPSASSRSWADLLDESPVFAANQDEDDAPPPPVAPVMQPIQVMQPIDPAEAEDVSIEITPRFEVASAPGGTDSAINMLVKIAPTGQSLVAQRVGPVAHQIIALDLSASMNHPDKYPVLTQALAGMLSDLQRPGSGEVLLSVVLFAYGSETLIKHVPASEIDVRDLLDQIDRSYLRFGRYTDIVGALKRAGRIALDSHKADKALPIRINVLTDGRPQDMEGAQRIMQMINKIPVDVDGLCFGADADVSAMNELFCGRKGGTVKVVRSDTIGEAFGRIAEVAQCVVAKRSILDLELRPGVVGGSAYRFRPGRHAFGQNAFKGGRRFQTELGTLESGREYQLLFQVRLPKTVQTETEIGRVTLKVPGYGGPRTFECLLSIPRHPGEDMPAPDALVVEAREILEAMDKDDPQAKLKALRARRKLYEAERRDPYIIELIDKAIHEIEEQGNLDALSRAEQAALLAHTCTVGLG